MRYLRYLILLAILVVLVFIGFGNVQPVSLAAGPDAIFAIAGLATPRYELPLVVVIFGSVFTGIVLGLLLEYIRESKHRRLASAKRREAERLRREVEKLAPDEDEDIPGLLAR